MDIHSYIADAEKQYHLRLKTVVPLDDAAMDKIEFAVAKYQPIELSRPVKTILQKHPLDFVGVENAEVWIVDMVFAMPAAAFVLRNDIRHALRVPEEYVLVREDNDPSEIESLRLNAFFDMDEEAKKKGLKPAGLMSDGLGYPEATVIDGADYYGNKYNSALLSYLYDVETSRANAVVLPTTPLFSNLDIPARGTDTSFNDNIPDAPPVIPKVKVKGPRVGRSIQGDVHDANLVVSRTYTDGKGKQVVLSRALGDMR